MSLPSSASTAPGGQKRQWGTRVYSHAGFCVASRRKFWAEVNEPRLSNLPNHAERPLASATGMKGVLPPGRMIPRISTFCPKRKNTSGVH
jgi:hypothetical protein